MEAYVKPVCIHLFALRLRVSTSHHSDLSVACVGHVENPQTSSAKPETDHEALELGTRMFLYLHPDTQTTENLKRNHTKKKKKKQDVVFMRS